MSTVDTIVAAPLVTGDHPATKDSIPMLAIGARPPSSDKTDEQAASIVSAASNHNGSITGNGSNNTDDGEDAAAGSKPSKLRTIITLLQLTGVNFISNASNGIVLVGLPAITADLDLSSELTFWPTSVANLTTASTILIAGSLADAVGARVVDLVGCFVFAIFMIATGASKSGSELVALRGIQGVGLSMHYAASVAITSRAFARGRSRNIAFSCLGLSQPLGFSFGLVVGGIMIDTIGWRAGWYIYGGIEMLLACIGIWALPSGQDQRTIKGALRAIRQKIDWVGALLASSFMALLSYLLAVLSADINKIKSAEGIVLLCLSAVTLPSFVYWVHRQVQRGKPALIPNRLWRNHAFSSVCGTVALCFAVLNSEELFASLFFQNVQHLSALQASIRILPSLVVGAALNLCTGLFIHKIPAKWIIVSTALLTAASPLLMAVIQPQWTYWANAFVAQLLQPICGDVLFTVGLVVITDVFPDDTQALAGAVFNTASQFGSALGFAIMQAISSLVTKEQRSQGDPHALMEGYRAGFWTMFGMMIVCALWGGLGLRKTGRVGLKEE